MTRICCRVIYAVAVIYVCLTIGSLAEIAMKHNHTPRIFKEPAEWKFAAGIGGETYHVRGCKFKPQQDPHRANLIYFQTEAEAALHNLKPCPHCITNQGTPPK